MQRKGTSKLQRSILHEVNPQTGQHRIVLLNEGGPDASSWFENHQIGCYKGFSFSIDDSEAIPKGIFRVAKVAHQELLS